MKRFHVNVSVGDLDKSTQFYSTLFGIEPTVRKDDYVKWMLEDPRINFSINSSEHKRGINHIGLQADTVNELAEIQSRLEAAGTNTFDQPDAECCYAKSTKTWVRDPDDVAWETFVTFGELTHYGNDIEPELVDEPSRCCSEPARDECCGSGN
jgi:catechol 2,3-dioxygenase-like lactoylglutathione lyase family enzyme